MGVFQGTCLTVTIMCVVYDPQLIWCHPTIFVAGVLDNVINSKTYNSVPDVFSSLSDALNKYSTISSIKHEQWFSHEPSHTNLKV